MYIKLVKVYSKNNSCKEIEFKDWVNLILWEKSDKSLLGEKKYKKTNWVWKSIAIDVIKFCLLQDFFHSRLSKIPRDLIEDEEFYLDLIINNNALTIKRGIANEKNPTIILEWEEPIMFAKLDDASEYILSLIFTNQYPNLSFRNFLAPLIKEEECEFKEITKYYSEKYSPFEAAKPQAFFFWIDLSLLKEIRQTIEDLKKVSAKESSLKKEIESSWEKLKDIPKKINTIRWELKTFEEKIEVLETNLASVSIEENLANINTKLEWLHILQSNLIRQIQGIKSLPAVEKINTNDIKNIYNYYTEWMWDAIKKSLDEVIKFKTKIENFQNVLMGNKLAEFNQELKETKGKISLLEQERSKALNLIDNQWLLKDFKNMFSILSSKKDEMTEIEYRYNELERQLPKKRLLNAEKEKLMSDLDNIILSLSENIKEFNDCLMDLWNKIMWNTSISFQIKTSQKKESWFLDFILRADSDWSHSVNRTRTFTYDIALMISNVTRGQHPKFLIHDNIFDVDQDSLIESLALLWELEKNNTFQYILTLNKDKIYSDDWSKIDFDVEWHKVLELTKTNRFFNFEYKEED